MKINDLISKSLSVLALTVSTCVSSNTLQVDPKLTEDGFEWITEKAALTIEVDCSTSSAIYIDEVIQQCQIFVLLQSKSSEYVFNIDGLNKDLARYSNRSLYPLHSISSCSHSLHDLHYIKQH
ncbi:hypothetical protein [Vibrio astriarenae]|uniref:hypothetical protein n=1 Tax=Vibrio astriarenae TaxID=1481923 RepID=UPI0037365EA8